MLAFQIAMLEDEALTAPALAGIDNGLPAITFYRDADGDNWRDRWDSLRHFTPASYDGLPGRPFPAPAATLPTAEERVW